MSPETSWMYLLDDDNILHCQFPRVVMSYIKVHQTVQKDLKFVVFGQRRNDRPLPLLSFKLAASFIDTGQYIVMRSEYMAGDWALDSMEADGMFSERIFNRLKHTNGGVLLSGILLTFHNRLKWADPPVVDCT